MVNYHPAKFGGHGHCGSRDTFIVFKGQDSTCTRLNPPLLFISKAYGMSCFHTRNFRRRHNNLPVCLMKKVRYWPYMFTLTTDGNCIKNLC